MPIFLSLAREASASSSAGAETGPTWEQLLEPSAPSPKISSHVIVHEMLRCACDPEMVIRGAAVAALKRLVGLCAQWNAESKGESGSATASSPAAGTPRESPFAMLVRTVILPVIRRGVRYANDEQKAGLYLLLGHVGHCFRHCGDSGSGGEGEVAIISSPGAHSHGLFAELHCDLEVLSPARDAAGIADPEQDFWLNLTNIQIHRRVRALGRLRALLSRYTDGAEGGNGGRDGCPIRTPSLVHILLPMALGLVLGEQSSSKEMQSLQQEGVALKVWASTCRGSTTMPRCVAC